MALSNNDLQHWFDLSAEVIVYDVYDKDDIYFSSVTDGEDVDKLTEALKIADNCIVRIYPRGQDTSGWATVVFDTDGPTVMDYADKLSDTFENYLN